MTIVKAKLFADPGLPPPDYQRAELTEASSKTTTRKDPEKTEAVAKARTLALPKIQENEDSLFSSFPKLSAAIMCNRMRIFSSAISASVFTEESPEKLVLRCELLALDMMRRLNIDTEEESITNKMLPMFLRASIEAVSEAARDGLSGSALDTHIGLITKGQTAVVASAKIRSMIEKSYPEMDSQLSIQLSLIAAMTKLISEAEFFSFGLSTLEVTRDASRRILSSCLNELERLTPQDVSEETGTMIFQTLVSCAGNIYAQIWRSAARAQMSNPKSLNEMTKDEGKAIVLMIGERFESAFKIAVALTLELLPPTPKEENSAVQSNGTSRQNRRVGMENG